MKPSAVLIEAHKSGQVGFGGSLKSLAAPEDEVEGLANTEEPAVELAAVATEAIESATEVSSSLSVSTKSRGFLIVGAASRNSNGSASIPLPKNRINKFQSSQQLEPASATNKY